MAVNETFLCELRILLSQLVYCWQNNYKNITIKLYAQPI